MSCVVRSVWRVVCTVYSAVLTAECCKLRGEGSEPPLRARNLPDGGDDELDEADLGGVDVRGPAVAQRRYRQLHSQHESCQIRKLTVAISAAVPRGEALNLRTTTWQKCEAVSRRARI